MPLFGLTSATESRLLAPILVLLFATGAASRDCVVGDPGWDATMVGGNMSWTKGGYETHVRATAGNVSVHATTQKSTADDDALHSDVLGSSGPDLWVLTLEAPSAGGYLCYDTGSSPGNPTNDGQPRACIGTGSATDTTTGGEGGEGGKGGESGGGGEAGKDGKGGEGGEGGEGGKGGEGGEDGKDDKDGKDGKGDEDGTGGRISCQHITVLDVSDHNVELWEAKEVQA